MNVWGAINPGLAPWAMREYRPHQGSSTTSLSLYYFDTLALVLCNGFHEVKKKYLSLYRASLKETIV